MIFVDTSVWIDYFNGNISWQTNHLHSLLEKEPIAIGDLVLAEVLQGFHSERDLNRAMQLLSPLPFYNMLGLDIAIQSANNYRILRKKGVAVGKTIDVMIATFCLSTKLPLLHDDRDFDPMEKYLKLQVIKKN